MLGNFDTPANPALAFCLHMIEEASERPGPAGATNQTLMQSDRQHAWRVRPFVPKLVEKLFTTTVLEP